MRHSISAASVLAVAIAFATPAQAQYPVKPVRLIIPFGAGSANDIVGRIIAPPLSEALGRPIVVENRPGAAGNIGAEVVAKSAPDGYTLMMGNIAHSVSMTLYDKPGYDLARDFAPVTMLSIGSFLLSVHPSVPARTVKQLVALARARPGDINVGVSGAGIMMASGLFQSMTGARMASVEYRSTPQTIIALVSGEVSVGFPSTSAAMPHVRSAKLRGLGVTTPRRSPMAPGIPTIAEAGVPGYEASSWYGLMAPAGTPGEIVARLNADTQQVLRRPDVVERFAATDMVPSGTTPEQFAAHVRGEIAKWGKIVKAHGIRPQ